MFLGEKYCTRVSKMFREKSISVSYMFLKELSVRVSKCLMREV